MTGSHPLAALLAALVLCGCASSTQAPRAAPVGGTVAGGGSVTSTPAAPVLSPATPPSPSACPKAGAATIPDGSWAGPVTVQVASVAGVPAGRTTGSGQLRLQVQGGRVVQGAWTATSRSTGQGTTAHGQATVQLTAEIAGTVQGPATKPALHAAWATSGTVQFTSPVTARVPVAGSGEGDTTMTVRASGCDAVTGTFAAPVNARNPLAGLSGALRWVGRRQG